MSKAKTLARRHEDDPDSAVETMPVLSSEQQSSAGGALARAAVQRDVAEMQAQMILARRFPRDQVLSRDRILNTCQRPYFAAKAKFSFPRGTTTVDGPTIRLAEEIAKQWGNITTGVSEIDRQVDAKGGYSDVVVWALDLESNFRAEKRMRVRHWRDLTAGGGYALRSERDIDEMVLNKASRRLRACILALVPVDIIEEAMDECEKTLVVSEKVTPERVAAMVERFGKMGVYREQIEAKIGRRLDTIAPAQMIQLRKIYTSITEGMSGPGDWFSVKQDDSEKVGPGGGDQLGAKLKERMAAGPPDPFAPQTKPVFATQAIGQPDNMQHSDATAHEEMKSAEQRGLAGTAELWREQLAADDPAQAWRKAADAAIAKNYDPEAGEAEAYFAAKESGAPDEQAKKIAFEAWKDAQLARLTGKK